MRVVGASGTVRLALESNINCHVDLQKGASLVVTVFGTHVYG